MSNKPFSKTFARWVPETLLNGRSVMLHLRVPMIAVPKRALMAFSPVLHELISANQDITNIYFDHDHSRVTQLGFKSIVDFMNQCITAGPIAELDHNNSMKEAAEIYRFGRLLGWDTYLKNIYDYLEEQLPCASKGATFGRSELELFQSLDVADPLYKRLVDILVSDLSTTQRESRKQYYKWVQSEFPKIGASMYEHATKQTETRARLLEQARSEWDAEVEVKKVHLRSINTRDLILREIDLDRSPRKRKVLNWDMWTDHGGY